MKLEARLLAQAQALNEARQTHQSQLLYLFVEDTIASRGDLEALQVQLDQHMETAQALAPARLSWCASVGIDRFGIFAMVEVQSCRFKLRYLPPNRFQMGSPKGEQGRRRGDEWPVHEVQLSRGYWLGETPCTQAVWETVMNSRPGRFVGADRPVEKVNFKKCQKLFEHMNAQAVGLNLGFPTEAQWEYACRGGTTTSTYAGPMEILGKHHAPVLDGIAWYGGNSGRDFDLEEGADASDWKDKQYAFSQAGTRAVGLKKPNAFGLYDMLGNVFEWCSDWYEKVNEMEPYSVRQDPVGPKSGDYRVIRGGAWDLSARKVRAAYRFKYRPNYQKHNLGLRFCRPQAAPLEAR